MQSKDIMINASSVGKCMTGRIGATEVQLRDIAEYDRKLTTKKGLGKVDQIWYDKHIQIPRTELDDKKREKLDALFDKKESFIGLTPTQKKDYDRLIKIRDTKELPQTAKTMLDEVVIELLYDQKKDIWSKHLAHGIATEQFGIDMINIMIDGKLKKYDGKVIRNKKLHLKGKPDVWVKGKLVIEVKNPYDPFTFNKKRKVLEELYRWQAQAYCWLCNVPVTYIIYTLNENYYMAGEGKTYDYLGLVDRMIVKKVARDDAMLQEYKERLPLIIKYLDAAQKLIVDDIDNTTKMLNEIKLLLVA